MSKEFGNRLEKLINASRYKKQDIANDVGVSPSALAKYLSGEREPNYEIMSNLATALDTTTDYLLGKADSDKEPFNECMQVFTRNSEALTKDEKIKLATILMKHIDR